ncbi:MAG: hypothetical protein ABI690_18665 [Chloroflexota bacterium]
MCRYAVHSYKRHTVCFGCRLALKAVSVCPYCHHAMISMGLDFKAPKRGDVKQWKKVEILYQNGINFHSCGCNGPGYRPRRLDEVEHFLATSGEINRRKSEGEKLLEKIDRFAGVKRKFYA